MVEQKCPISQSSLKRYLSDSIVGDLISYKCSLLGEEHYTYYLENHFYPAENCIRFFINDKKYKINQYLDNYSVIVSIYDSDDKYLDSSNFYFEKMMFDFSNDNLDKIIDKLKIILLFK